MPITISLCSAKQPGEHWRTGLAAKSTIVNVAEGLLPNISAEAKGSKNQFAALLITGGHGDAKTEIYNGVQIRTWRKWIKAQPSSVRFNCIITDMCDSACLTPYLTTLLKKDGVIFTNVSTGHGVRASLVKSGFDSMEKIKIGINEAIVNGLVILNGTNIGVVKEQASLVSCIGGDFDLEYDARVPVAVAVGDDEQKQRALVVEKTVTKASQNKQSFYATITPDISTVVSDLSETESPRCVIL